MRVGNSTPHFCCQEPDINAPKNGGATLYSSLVKDSPDALLGANRLRPRPPSHRPAGQSS